MAKGPKQEGDWLKYYCIVFGLLIVVVGVLYFKIKGERAEYEKANSLAKQFLTTPKTDRDGRPTDIPNLALEIKQFVDAYQGAVGGDTSGSISTTVVDRAATKANMTGLGAGSERRDPNLSKGYETISRDFTYKPADLERLIKLMYNIEVRRYRVYDVRWQLAEEKLQTPAPKNKIIKSVIKVGFRKPLAKERN